MRQNDMNSVLNTSHETDVQLSPAVVESSQIKPSFNIFLSRTQKSIDGKILQFKCIYMYVLDCFTGSFSTCAHTMKIDKIYWCSKILTTIQFSAFPRRIHQKIPQKARNDSSQIGGCGCNFKISVFRLVLSTSVALSRNSSDKHIFLNFHLANYWNTCN